MLWETPQHYMCMLEAGLALIAGYALVEGWALVVEGLVCPCREVVPCTG